MIVKICGVTRYEDAVAAAELGADLIGLNFAKVSPRYIDPSEAGKLADHLRQSLGVDSPKLVGVFVNAPVSDISHIMEIAGLNYAQLSGDESDEMLDELRGIAYKAIRPPNKALAIDDVNYYTKALSDDMHIPSILLDAYHPKLYGGTGEQASADVALAVKALVPRMMLAGGLNPDNVAERVRQIQPWGVDVASGVEVEGYPGIKDRTRMAAFIQQAKNS